MTMQPLPMPAAPAPVERAARHTTLLLIARACSHAREDLCRIRDISTAGMRIEILAPIDVGQLIVIKLKNGVAVESEVVWVNEAEAGVRFAAPIDIDRVLAPADRACTPGGHATRSPHLSARCAVTLRHDGHILSAILTNISQSGAHVGTSSGGEVGDQVVLFIPGLGSQRAAIRFVSEAETGLTFIDKLGFVDLAAWLAGSNRFSPLTSEQVTPIRQSS